MELESLNTLLKVGMFVGGICAVGALVTEAIINKRQAFVVLQLTRDIEDARAKTAETALEVARARAEAEKARAESGALAIRLSEQQERTAKAERELLELRRRVDIRRIDQEDRSQLIASLRNATAKGPVTVFVPSGDAEPFLYAEQILAAIRASGWPCDGIYIATSDHFVGEPWVLTVGVNDPAAPPPHCPTFQRALHDAGIETVLVGRASVAPEGVNLFVDPKPPM